MKCLNLNRTRTGRADTFMLAKVPLSDFQEYLSRTNCFHVDTFNNFTRVMNLPQTNTEFRLINLKRISLDLQTDFDIILNGKSLYSIKKRFSNCFYIELTSDQGESEIFEEFKVNFSAPITKFMCKKTKSCTYTTDKLSNIKRHENCCTDGQKILEKQIAYGSDTSPVKRLIELKHLPSLAANFRKDFFTTFDIECFEDTENSSELRNVVAIHKLVSVAISTNKGHSKCFVRKDSSHDAVIELTEQFLDFIDKIGIEYRKTLPDYFTQAIDKLDYLTSKESDVQYREKMELCALKRSLKKYLLHEIFGFNSGTLR